MPARPTAASHTPDDRPSVSPIADRTVVLVRHRVCGTRDSACVGASPAEDCPGVFVARLASGSKRAPRGAARRRQTGSPRGVRKSHDVVLSGVYYGAEPDTCRRRVVGPRRRDRTAAKLNHLAVGRTWRLDGRWRGHRIRLACQLPPYAVDFAVAALRSEQTCDVELTRDYGVASPICAFEYSRAACFACRRMPGCSAAFHLRYFSRTAGT